MSENTNKIIVNAIHRSIRPVMQFKTCIFLVQIHSK